MNAYIQELRGIARQGFDAAVAQANPAHALERAFETAPPKSVKGRVFVIAVGKAAPAMMRAALHHLEDRDVVAICVTHKGNPDRIENAQMFYAGHPIPDADGEAAAKSVINALKSAGQDDTVLALISGGGSALLPAPADGISLADKQALNNALLSSGLDIVAMNTVRQQVSQIKGGGLIRLASPAPVQAYILSDVIGDDLRAIASGPTAPPIGSRAQALDLIKGLEISQPVLAHLSKPMKTSPMPDAENYLIGGNRQSVTAAAASVDGFAPVKVAQAPLVGDVAQAAQTIMNAAQNANGPQILIWGGETTVTLTGSGLGGRNQELALRIAHLAESTPLPCPWAFLSGGTDGRDGPTQAAGAIVDGGTIARIRTPGGSVDALLSNNDSNAALRLSDDLLICGATGTNVADIQVMVLGKTQGLSDP